MDSVEFNGEQVEEIDDFLIQNKCSEKLKKLSLTNIRLTNGTYLLLTELINLIELKLKFCRISNLFENFFNNLVHLEYLNLEKNLLKILPENLFNYNLKLKTIILRKNQLSSLPLLLFSNLSCLEILDLGENYFQNLTFFFIRNTSLKTLMLDDNNTTCIDSYSFSNLKSLTYLNLENNNLYNLKPNSFFNLWNLKLLNLNGSKIMELYPKSLCNLINLEYLFLNENSLEQLPSNVFCNLRNLHTLTIIENPLSTLNVTIFNNNPLKYLKLELRETLDWKLFKNINQLQTLDLTVRNTETITLDEDFIKYFHCKTKLKLCRLVLILVSITRMLQFGSIKNLKELYIESIAVISRVKRSYISWYSFDGLHNLEKLILINLNLFIIQTEDDSTISLPSLRYLLFKGKDITVMEFPTLPKLTYLRLEDSPMMSLDKNVIRSIPNLTLVYFLHTRLSLLSNTMFQNNRYVIELDLCKSRIKHIPKFFFVSLERLRILNLSYNYIKKVDHSTFYGLRSLVKLDLSYNPITFFHKQAILNLRELEAIILDGVSINIEFSNSVPLRIIK